MANNQIGEFDFIRLENQDGGGPPDTLGEMSEVVERPGINGSGIVRTGRRGDTVQMVSRRDTVSRAAAAGLLVNYKTLQGQSPQRLVWQANDYDTQGVRFIVLMVKPLEAFELQNMVGGLEGSRNVGGMAVAEWTLKPVPMA